MSLMVIRKDMNLYLLSDEIGMTCVGELLGELEKGNDDYILGSLSDYKEGLLVVQNLHNCVTRILWLQDIDDIDSAELCANRLQTSGQYIVTRQARMVEDGILLSTFEGPYADKSSQKTTKDVYRSQETYTDVDFSGYELDLGKHATVVVVKEVRYGIPMIMIAGYNDSVSKDIKKDIKVISESINISEDWEDVTYDKKHNLNELLAGSGTEITNTSGDNDSEKEPKNTRPAPEESTIETPKQQVPTEEQTGDWATVYSYNPNIKTDDPVGMRITHISTDPTEVANAIANYDGFYDLTSIEESMSFVLVEYDAKWLEGAQVNEYGWIVNPSTVPEITTRDTMREGVIKYKGITLIATSVSLSESTETVKPEEVTHYRMLVTILTGMTPEDFVFMVDDGTHPPVVLS